MPFAESSGARLFYRLEGRDDRPAVVFSHSLGVDHGQWDTQTADLLPHFRVLRYDLRGHGASDAPVGDYTLDQMGRDVLAVADAAGIRKFAFCGLSIGGMIGQWLGANASDRLTHLVLANTASKYSTPEMMEARRALVLKSGMVAAVDSVMQRFFLPQTLEANPPGVASVRRAILATNPVGYAGCCAVVRDLNMTAALAKIQAPTLVIYGEHDQSTPWVGTGDVLAKSIRGAKIVALPTAHLSNVEQPRSFSTALLDFLLPSGEADPLKEGFSRRREVLGDAHVDRAIADTTAFTAEFQELITRYAWGTVWARPALDARTRRMLVLTALGALGRWEEFRMHLRAGLARELEPCDVKELLLQAAIYAGVPVANAGFHIAAEELKAIGEPRNP